MVVYRNTSYKWLFELIKKKSIIPKSFISFSKFEDSGGQDNFGGTRITFDKKLLEKQGLIEVFYERHFFETYPEICLYVTGYRDVDHYYQENDYEDEEDFLFNGREDETTLDWDTYLEDYATEGEFVIKKLKFVPGIIKFVEFTEDKPVDTKLLDKAKIPYDNSINEFFTFNEFEKIGGAEAGKLDLVHDDIDAIIEYAVNKCKEYGRDIFEEVPDFKKNLLIAKSKFELGKTKRYDMPVIPTGFVKEFQRRLSQGHIDLNKPFHQNTDPSNPFPEGLTGQEAKEFLKRGLLDGEEDDDKIKVKPFKEKAINLKPIQQQVYVDKSIDKIARDGAQGCRRFLVNKQLITSSDGFIIDGHHRLLTSLIVDPTIKLQGIEIDMDIEVLKKLALAYGDAIGNKRNL